MRSDFEAKYHALEDAHAWSVARRDVVRRTLRAHGVTPEARVVEIGCAGGALLADLASDGFRDLSAVDVTEAAVERARAREVAEVTRVDGVATPFDDDTFDVLIASDVLEHIADEAAALAEWRRIVRPGGLAVVFVPAFMALWSEHDVVNRHERRYTLSQLVRVTRSAGFHVRDARYWNASLFLPTAASRVAARLVRGVRRAPPADASAAADDFRPLPAPVNAALIQLLKAENRWFTSPLRFPAGVSAAVVLQRPAHAA